MHTLPPVLPVSECVRCERALLCLTEEAPERYDVYFCVRCRMKTVEDVCVPSECPLECRTGYCEDCGSVAWDEATSAGRRQEEMERLGRSSREWLDAQDKESK